MVWPQTGDQALLRKINLASVLGYIHGEAPISRVRLAHLTQLNKSTISSLVVELIERGLVHETGLDSSGAGRPATHLELNPNAGRILGVELGVGFISVMLTDFTGRLLGRGTESITGENDQQSVIAAALRIVDRLLAGFEPERRLLGVGLTVPGMVNLENRVLVFSPNLRWRNSPLGEIFSRHTGAGVWIENDANASALAEHLFGVARKNRHFIFVTLGVGIGGGLFLNGELYRGAGGFAGEIGHTSLSMEQNQPCRCGNSGCWENSTNQYALIERVRARLDVGRPSRISAWMAEPNAPLTLEMIAQAADQGDVTALEALSETGRLIGLKVANLINLFNPERIVLGGAMSIVAPHLLPAIQDVIETRALPEGRGCVQVDISAFGSDANVVGAMALVVKSILSDPTQVARVVH